MLNIGVIGTNWISESFIQAAIASKRYQLVAVYSRSLATGKNFADKFAIDNVITDIDEFLQSQELDVVYIASPNSYHYQHTMLAVKYGKHVIVEKPSCSNPNEMQQVLQLANENNVCVFEAARHMHEHNFQIVKQQLNSLGKIEGANLSYMKYSSRYDLVLKGELTNVFSLEFSGGAMADLGVYLIYFAVALFGVPQKYNYIARKISTGVDGIGIIIFNYSEFDVVMQTGKIADSFLSSEIYGSQKTLILDGVTEIKSIELYDRKTNQREQLAVAVSENNLLEEVISFADILENINDEKYREKYKYLQQLSVAVNKIMTELRHDAGVIFMADKI